jgi:hypothetical protein
MTEQKRLTSNCDLCRRTHNPLFICFIEPVPKIGENRLQMTFDTSISSISSTPMVPPKQIRGGAVGMFRDDSLRLRKPHRSLQADEECYDVSKADFRFAGLFNYEAPWLPQCTGCAEKGDPECFDNPCWCIPDGGQDGCCPDPGERPISYDWQVADAFKSYVEISEPIVLDPPGCDPWPINQELYPNLTMCNEFPEMSNPNAVCAFMYKDDDQNCGGLDAREYELRTFTSYDEAVAAGGVVTHYGGKWIDTTTLFVSVWSDH